jgi:hypothetical protein
VEPTSGPPGTTFTFVGRSDQFIPGEQVGSWFIAPDGSPLNVDQGQSVDPNGQIFRMWKAPEGISGGEWTFRAVGISSRYNIDMKFYIDAPILTPTPVVTGPFEVVPDSGPPGTSFIFTAGGYQSNELVSNWLVRPDGVSLDAASWIQANPDGIVRWQWTAPPDTAGGQWQWQLSGTQTEGRQSIPFQIEGDIPLPAPVSPPPGAIVPSSGPPQTIFTVRVAEFAPGEGVFFWAEDPTGQPIVNEREVQANGEGVAEWQWQAPENARPGDWLLVVRGRLRAEGERVQIPFTITNADGSLPFSGVEPEAGGPGTTFSFFVRGYTSGELVDIYASAPDGRPYDVTFNETASQRGVVEWQWTPPPGVPTGTWQMNVSGRQVDSPSYAITFTLTDSGPTPTPSVPYGAVPASGPPGTTFTLYAEGYPPGESVSYWLTAPDNTVIVENEESGRDRTFADGNGRVEVVWTAPPGAQRGTWQLTTRTSNPETTSEVLIYTIRFTVE